MKRIFIVIVALLIIGLIAVLALNRTDSAAGAAPAIAGAPAGGRLRRLPHRAGVGQAVRRRRGVQVAVRHHLFHQHHVGSDPWHRRLQRRGIRACRARGSSQGRAAFVPRLPLHLVYRPEPRRCARDQGVSDELAGDRGAQSARRSRLPVQPALGHDVLERGVFQERALRSGRLEARTVEQRCLPRHRARSLRRMSHAAQPRLRTRARPGARGPGASGMARLQHHGGHQVRHRRLVRRRRPRLSRHRSRPRS